MKLLAIIVTFLALLIAVLWLFYSPGFDSCFAAVGASAAFISAFFLGRPATPSSQIQKVSGNSTAVQGGRDVNTGDITK